jgi:hypothetical protein
MVDASLLFDDVTPLRMRCNGSIHIHQLRHSMSLFSLCNCLSNLGNWISLDISQAVE